MVLGFVEELLATFFAFVGATIVLNFTLLKVGDLEVIETACGRIRTKHVRIPVSSYITSPEVEAKVVEVKPKDAINRAVPFPLHWAAKMKEHSVDEIPGMGGEVGTHAQALRHLREYHMIYDQPHKVTEREYLDIFVIIEDSLYLADRRMEEVRTNDIELKIRLVPVTSPRVGSITVIIKGRVSDIIKGRTERVKMEVIRCIWLHKLRQKLNKLRR